MYINIYSYKLWFIIMANNVFFLQNLKKKHQQFMHIDIRYNSKLTNTKIKLIKLNINKSNDMEK